ncbi:MAG: hypothetical protein AAF384_08720 [Pseudomonadota bacterium]
MTRVTAANTGALHWTLWPVLMAALVLPLAHLGLDHLLAGFNWDDAIYLLMADAYFGRLDDIPVLEQTVFAWRSYPPLYPLLIGLFGGGATQLETAFVVNAAAGGAAVVLLYCYARQLTGNLILSAQAALILALTPAALSYANGLWSENLFIPMSLCALLIARSRARHAIIFSALLFALAAITRTAGIAYCLGFTAWLASTKPEHWKVAGVIACLIPIAERTLNQGTYLALISGRDFSASAMAGELYGNASALVVGFAHNWAFHGAFSIALGTLVFALAAWALIQRRFALEALLLATYCVSITLWGYPEQAARFVYPLMPLTLVLALTGASSLPAQRRFNIAAFIVLLAVGGSSAQHLLARWTAAPPDLPNSLRMSHAFLFAADPQSAHAQARYRAQIVRDIQHIETVVQPRECVVSELPALVLLHARRAATPSPWPSWGSLAENRHTPCRYYYALPAYFPGETLDVVSGLGATPLFVSPGYDPQAPGAPTGVLFDFFTN